MFTKSFMLSLLSAICFSSAVQANRDYEVMGELSDGSTALAHHALAELSGQESFDVSLILANDMETKEDWRRKLAAHGLENLMPAVLEILESARKSAGKNILSHITIRVDPNTNRMGRNLNRQASQNWHNHMPTTTQQYFFTLAKDEDLTTQVRVDGQIIKTPPFTLVTIAGSTMHRTPPHRPGKRIQISLSLLAPEKDPENAIPLAPIVKRLKRISDDLAKEILTK